MVSATLRFDSFRCSDESMSEINDDSEDSKQTLNTAWMMDLGATIPIAAVAGSVGAVG
jgi:hypothetical protein